MKKKTTHNKIHLTVVGALGRMGTQIVNLAQNDSRFQVVAGVEMPGHPGVGRIIAQGRAPVVDDIEEVLPKTDVVIDFTTGLAVLKSAEKAARKKKAYVSGTTGLKPQQIQKLKNMSKRIPLVFSPNMSLGVNVLFRVLEKAAVTLKDYDIEIVEAHHNQKKDAPSGTAVRLAEIASQATGRKKKDWVFGRHGWVGERRKKEIGVLAIRAGEIVGDHTVYLSGAGERLELIHRAQSRDAFASGALTAAAWVTGKRPGFYSMADVLKI